MTSSVKHEHLSTSTTVQDRVIKGCFLLKETTKAFIDLKAFQVESDSVSFLITYQINVEIRNKNLDEHMFVLEPLNPVFKYNIPKQYLVSQETCFDDVMIILSEFRLLPSIHQRLVSYISTESVSFSNPNCGKEGGFTIEVNVNVNVEQLVRIGNCNKEICRVRARRLARKLKTVECSMCLTKLSSAVSRMKFQCSHVFHRHCVMMWLKKNPSCPICRASILGNPVSLF